MRRSRLAGRGVTKFAVPVLLAGAVAGSAPGPPAAATVSRTGSPGAAASFTVAGYLYAVAATSPGNAWAVGYTLVSNKTLILRWNGTAWKQVPSPNPGNVGNFLYSVAATSAGNAWAVGAYTYRHHRRNGIQSMILRWNGTAWKQVPFPHPPGGSVVAVAATSARNAWAVGSWGVGPHGVATRTLILRWNGTAWRQVPRRLIGGPACCAGGFVAATSARDAWAVGAYRISRVGTSPRTLMLHWNGTSWKRAPSPTPTENDCGYGTYLHAVAATSPRNAWAVGSEDCNTLILHWNGTAWKQVPSPSPTCYICAYGDSLDAVAATSARNAWAVGDIGHATGAGSLIVRWNGTSWKQVPSPNPDPQGLTAVAAVSARDAWAIGFTSTPRPGKAMILHWNGTSWK